MFNYVKRNYIFENGNADKFSTITLPTRITKSDRREF